MESESNNTDKWREETLSPHPGEELSRKRDATGAFGRDIEVRWEHGSHNNRAGEEVLPGSKVSEASGINRLIGRQWRWL